MVLKGDEQIVFVENFDPIQGRKLRWYQNPALQTLGVNLQPTMEPLEIPLAVLVDADAVPPRPLTRPPPATQESFVDRLKSALKSW